MKKTINNRVSGSHIAGSVASILVVVVFCLMPVKAQQPPTGKLTPATFTNTRDMRFCEILVVKPTGVDVYNTTGLNDCPADKWDTMKLSKVREQFGAASVQKNGPHYWMMDSQSLLLGAKALFNGIEARYAATLDPAIIRESEGSQPYRVFMPKKRQKQVYSKGKPVFELVDPEGYVYVMQARDHEFALSTLGTLGDRMKQLPKGWEYRTRVLTEDLIIDLTPDRTIHAVGDEFHQYYTRIPETD